MARRMEQRAARSWHDHPAPWAVAALLLLVVSVRLLGAATTGLGPWVSGWLPRVVDGPASAVGAAWLSSYLLMNGSLVAAVAVSFHHAGLVDSVGLMLFVAGARMGASGIIIVLGALASLRRPRPPLHEATRLGVLASLVTLTVYGPIAAVGIVMTDHTVLPDAVPGAFDATSGALVVMSLALLWLSLWLLDRGVSRMDQAWFRRKWASRLQKPWVGAAVGLVVTVASASVAVSIGALVPLFNRGILTRRQAVPYILGANVGTLSDTLVMAAALGSGKSLLALLSLGGLAAAITLVMLFLYPVYSRSIDWMQDRIIASRRSFWVAAGVFVGMPLALLLW